MPKPQHILIIRLSAMGDVAMTVPVVRVFAAQYPNVQITFLSKKQFKPLFKDIPSVTFYEADIKGKHQGALGLLRLASELKKLKITHIADLHNVLRSKTVRKYLSFYKIIIQKIDKGRAEKKALTRAGNKEFKPLKTTVERYAEVFEKLGFPLQMETHHFPKPEALSKSLLNLFDKNKKAVGIAPFAAHKGKMYPMDLMEEVIKSLEAENKCQLFLFGGGEDEKNTLTTIENNYPSTVNLVGKFSFEEELQIISHLDIMLAMDSGNAHLSAIYNIPTVTLWGVTHPYAGFYPFNQPEENALLSDRIQFPLIPTSIYGNKYPEGYENCMRSISPERVLEKIKDLLS